MTHNETSRTAASEAFERITPDYQEYAIGEEAQAWKRELMSLFPDWKPGEQAESKEHTAVQILYENAVDRFGHVLRRGVVDGATGHAFLDSEGMSAKEANITEVEDLAVEPTDRGFLLGEFKDLYGKDCTLQESSGAEVNAIWLGREDKRMHLTQEMVLRLLPHLVYFAENGELPRQPE